MINNILAKSGSTAGMMARLKVSPAAPETLQVGLTASEQQLSDIVEIGVGARKKAQDVRKLDSYLRLFSSALKFFNGFSARHTPQYSKVEVEFYNPDKNKSIKLDA